MQLDDVCSIASLTETENVTEDNAREQKMSNCGICHAQTVLASRIFISSHFKQKDGRGLTRRCITITSNSK